MANWNIRNLARSLGFAALAAMVAVAPVAAQEVAPEQLAMARKYIDLTDRGAIFETTVVELGIDTMRQIVSLRMPDALLERVEEAARARGVSPSSLMRALIAAGLDRSYAAVREAADPRDLASEIAALGERIDALARAVEGRREADDS